MSFIRSKQIPPRTGNWYDYEVETTRKNGKVLQKVIKYIGKSTTHSSIPPSKTLSLPSQDE